MMTHDHLSPRLLPLASLLSVLHVTASSDVMGSTTPPIPRHTLRTPPAALASTPRPDAHLADGTATAAATSTMTHVTQRTQLQDEFDCPRAACQCYLLRPDNQVWLNCTFPRLDSSAEQRATLRDIPVTRSAFLSLTCTQADPLARSYLYDAMFSHLSDLLQLDLINCRFQDIPRHAFRGLTSLEVLHIKGAHLIGQVHPEFAASLGKLRALQVIESHLHDLPPLCSLQRLRTLNVSYSHLQQLQQAGVMCASAPLLALELFDISNNNISVLPDWASQSFPHLLRLSAAHNAIPRVDAFVCDQFSKLMFLDLSFNALRDVTHLNLANCSNLRVLRLGGNLLHELPAQVFNNMHMLQQLSLFSMGLDDNVWDRISVLTYLDELELHDNSLITIPPGVMQEFTNLQHLNLSSNRIRILPKKAFIWQYKLTSLDLSSNGMTELPRQAFSSNLHSLQVLNLANNSLSFIEQTTFSSLRLLKWLNCSDNRLKSIPEEAFAGLSHLQVLDLSRNQLRTVSAEAFVHVSALTHVLLAHNHLTAVPPMSGLSSLLEVDLSYNNLTSLPPTMFTNLPNLEVVRLRGNSLQSLSPKNFQDCVSLRLIDMAHNALREIPEHFFFNVQRLEHVDLSFNRLQGISSVFASIKPRVLLLSGNNLVTLFRGDVPPTVEILDLSRNRISQISPFTFTSLYSISHVNLTFNELTTLSAAIMEISYAQAVYSQPVFYLRGNPLRCDCTLGWLKDWSLGMLPSNVLPLPKFDDLDLLHCHSTYPGSNVTSSVTETARGHFICTYSRKCDEGCVCCSFDACHCSSVCPDRCRCFTGDHRYNLNRIDCSSSDLALVPEFIPDSATEILLDGNNLGTCCPSVTSNSMSFLGHKHALLLRLNNSDIHAIENNTFLGLSSLKELYLHDNHLSVIYVATFRVLDRLEVLVLHDNDIAFIEDGAFKHMTQLRVLNLERNLLAFLLFSDLLASGSLTSLRLKDNPWTCAPNFTCQFIDFANNRSAVSGVEQIACYFADASLTPGGKRANGTLLLSLSPSECLENVTAPVNVTHYVIKSVTSEQNMAAVIAVAAMSACCLLAVLVVYINRHLLQVWCFTKFGWRVFKMAPAHEDKNRPYDAFVSYSNLDEDFVVQELAPRLENGYKHFRLCLHYRDFPVGASIAETIVKSVETSKRTIMLVSNNFLDSEWCKFEFQTAHQQVLTERRNRVILILLHDVEQHKLDQTLRLYMRTRTYLRYDDPWFWEKLVFAMPDKKAEKFARLPSSRDLEYMSRVGRERQGDSPLHNGHLNINPAFVNGHTPVVTDMIPNDMYEIPVASLGSYERMTGSGSVSSSIYNASLSAGSGHYEEVTPRTLAMRPVISDLDSNVKPPPLPPLPKKGLLPHEALIAGSLGSRETVSSREENWV